MDHEQYSVAAAFANAVAVRRREHEGRHYLGLVAMLLSALCAFALLFAKEALAQEASAQVASAQEVHVQPSPECGQTRWVLVRFLNGKPAAGIIVDLTAALADMGGPQLYATGGSLRSLPGQSAPIGESDQGIAVAPQPTLGMAGCKPVISGTLTAITDLQGRARFDRLGEGVWVALFEGEVTHAGHTASIVPASIQGLFPYGRTRGGGGFLEQVTALNEEGGSNPGLGPVQAGAGPTTSRYVLEFSAIYGGWLPSLDLADMAEVADVKDVATEEVSSGQDAPPVPLERVTPLIAVTPVAPLTAVSTATRATPATQATPQTTLAGITPSAGHIGNEQAPTTSTNGVNGAAPESTFDPTRAEVVPWLPTQHQPASPTADRNIMRWFNIWWIAVLGLTLGGVLALVWARMQSSNAGMGERTHRTSPEGGEDRESGESRNDDYSTSGQTSP